jgi:nitrite reductase/ring-hydroxylating ferredoxin subunit
MYAHGWYQVAFEHELTEGLTPVSFAQQRLMIVKHNEVVRLFEATCPHRGAHLAYGGTLDGDEVVCPFHGLRIHLGQNARAQLSVREFTCLVQGGMVFVRLSDVAAPHLPQALEAIQQHYTFISGFTMEAHVPFEIATENALDNLHFKSVHGILNEPVFTVHTGAHGELRAAGEFLVPTGMPSRPAHVQYSTGAFSPGIVVSELHGDPPYNYIIISTATPAAAPDHCTIRLTLAMQRPVDEHFTKILMDASRQGLEKDRAIWQRIAPNHIPQWTSQDTSAKAFAQFCQQFRWAAPSQSP